MRAVIWFLLLFVVAVVAAGTLGPNDGIVTIYWGGSYRLDTSLNLFLLALVATCFVLASVIQALNSLTGLPRRAHEWRVARRDRIAQAALREALAQYFGGRYSRAQSAALKALAIQADTPDLSHDNEFTVLGHLLAAGSAHRLQDRTKRDDQLKRALELARSSAARAAEEGARLLAAEWALDDRDAARALELLSDLPPGVSRRTHALRLKLQATRLAKRPQEALKTARLLAKHQGFSKVAAQGLLRSLASESLATAHDVDQLRRIWLQFEAADRRDPVVAASAAIRASALGAPEEGRAWLRPFWDRLGELSADDRACVAQGLIASLAGIGPDWLQRLEAAAQAFPREPAIAHAVGSALAERGLWGKARALLESAAEDTRLPLNERRHVRLSLARLAEEEGDNERAVRCYESAARLV